MTTHHPVRPIDPAALHAALTLRDLTDPNAGPHAMQVLLDAIRSTLAGTWGCSVLLHRASALTSVADNYDRLHYPADGVARDARYTRYIDATRLLRTHTTAMIPPLLRTLAAARIDDVLLVCPGLVYRRDCIDRLHAAEPHQLDLWRLRAGPVPLGSADLARMIECVVAAAVPGAPVHTIPARHPYTEHGVQIDVEVDGVRVEIGECGVASPAVLREAGLPPSVSGLAMGLGLDRVLMLRKRLADIRLLRASDPRIAAQMVDLTPYRPVSRKPAIARDLSIVVGTEADAEALGDRVRAALGPRATSVEEIVVLGQTAYEELPAQAVARLQIRPDQKNLLLRVVLRDLDRTLTASEANDLRNAVYAAVHEGPVHEWAGHKRAT